MSIDSPVGNYLESLKTKLQTSSFITAPGNVVIGESVDVLGLSDDSFPRLEVLITKDKSAGYGAQRQIDFEFRYSIAGYLRRDSDDVVIGDMVNAMNFGIEVRSLNYEFLDDKQAGNPPCVGFTRMGEFSETFYEYEMFPKTTAFILEISAFLYLSDTQTA